MKKFLKFYVVPILYGIAIALSVLSMLYLSAKSIALGYLASSAIRLVAVMLATFTLLLAGYNVSGKYNQSFVTKACWAVNASCVAGAIVVLVTDEHCMVYAALLAVLSVLAIGSVVKHLKHLHRLYSWNTELTYKLSESNTELITLKTKYNEQLAKVIDLLDRNDKLANALTDEQNSHAGCKANLNAVQAKRAQEVKDYETKFAELNASWLDHCNKYIDKATAKQVAYDALNKEFNEVATRLQELDTERAELAKQLDAERTKSGKTAEYISSLQQKYDVAIKERDAERSMLKDADNTISKLKLDLNIWQDKYNSCAYDYDEVTKQLAVLTNKLKTAEQQVQTLTQYKTEIEAKRAKANARRREKRSQNKQDNK